jgi:hypothetical protein
MQETRHQRARAHDQPGGIEFPGECDGQVTAGQHCQQRSLLERRQSFRQF